MPYITILISQNNKGIFESLRGYLCNKAMPFM